MFRGMFTPMGKNPQPRLTEEMQSVVDGLRPMIDLGIALGWPQEWRVCDHCGEHSWMIPPHVFDPCPMVIDAMHTAGMKMDAERMQAVKAGLVMQDQMQALKTFLQQMGEGDEE